MKLGSFNIFSSKRKDYGTLHCLDTREWNDGYSPDNKGLIKFLKHLNGQIILTFTFAAPPELTTMLPLKEWKIYSF